MTESPVLENKVPAMPLVSICLPVYNKAPHLASVLDGILAQPYRNLEIVISDNGSDDGSSDIAREIARRDPRIRYHRLDHTISLNENWRLVMRLATGEFCKVQSADDPLHGDFLTAMLPPLLADPTLDFAVCREAPRFHNVEDKIDTRHWIAYFQNSAELCRQITLIPDQKNRARLLVERNLFINHLGNIYKILYRRSCLPTERWRHLSAAYPMPQAFADWDFLLRLFLNHRGHFVDRILTTFDFDPQSPFVKLQTNPQMQLAAATQDYLMPLTILTDPTLRPLREWLSSHNRDQVFAYMAQKLRDLSALSAKIDALARQNDPPSPPTNPQP